MLAMVSATLSMSTKAPALRCLHRSMPARIAVPNFARSLKAAAAEGGQGGSVQKQEQQNKPQRQQQTAGVPSRRVSPYQTTGDLFSIAPPSFGRLSRFARDLQDEIDSVLGGFGDTGILAPFSSPSPTAQQRPTLGLPVDVKETEKDFVISADVPGLAKEDVKVQINKDNILTISGKRESEHKEEEGGKVYRIERSWGSFQRSFQLPENIDTSQVGAKVDNGVLRVTVPKTEITEHEVVNVDIE